MLAGSGVDGWVRSQSLALETELTWGRGMAALRVGDRVLYDGKSWRVESLGRHAYHREGDQMIAGGELHAVLLLDAEMPGQQPHKVVVPESAWDETRLLEE
jgi:hypothetical protein